MVRPFAAHSPDMLYVHWPFCASKCHYCDFVAMEGHDKFAQQYHDALCNEVRSFVASRGQVKKHKIKTIFFGGGTPSLYPLPLLREFFALLHDSFDLSELQESSLEVNPGGQTEEHFKTWRELGINRLSVGVQVLDDKVLAKLNRYQTNADVHAFFATAPQYFDNLSADLIIGLPGVTDEVWFNTVNAALAWPISHFSLYFLTVHENTPLYHGVKADKIRLPKDDAMLAQYAKTRDILRDAGFEQYEISNFAKPGFACQHNQGYWQRTPYHGFGLGAASYDGSWRYANIKKLGDYTDLFATVPADKQIKYSYTEQLTLSQQQMEELMLGLRQANGVDLHRMVYLCDAQERASFLLGCKQLVTDGFLEQNNTVIRLTQKGQIFENEVVVKLCQSLEAQNRDADNTNVE